MSNFLSKKVVTMVEEAPFDTSALNIGFHEAHHFPPTDKKIRKSILLPIKCKFEKMFPVSYPLAIDYFRNLILQLLRQFSLLAFGLFVILLFLPNSKN